MVMSEPSTFYVGICRAGGSRSRCWQHSVLRQMECEKTVKRVLIRPYDWGRKQYPILPAMRSVEERVGADVEPPAVCPKCGEAESLSASSGVGSICLGEIKRMLLREGRFLARRLPCKGRLGSAYNAPRLA